jgi:aminoglycoside 2'-N-acetyltransferase I
VLPLRSEVLHDADVPAELLRRLRLLVDEAFGGEFAEEDWEHTCGGWRVVTFDGELLVAHAAVSPRLIRVGERPFNAGYVEGVATLSARQRQGLGSLVMREATEIVRRQYELGVLSTGLPSFYERLGWERWRGPTFVQDGDALIRTQDEDDGILVLRHGPSQAVDLTAPIICESRSGDDW